MLGQFASRVDGKMCKALPYDILILKRQVLSKCCALEHECESLGGHWGSLGVFQGLSKMEVVLLGRPGMVLGGPWGAFGGIGASLGLS